MRRIAVSCIKGGVAKTTTTTSLAVGLARRGKRVLVIDGDAQAHATWLLTGGQGAEGPGLAEVLTRRAGALEAIRPSAVPGVDLLPAASSLGAVNVALAQELSRDTRLRSAMAEVDGYDVAIADTGPAFTSVLANVLVWAAEVLTPVDCGMLAVLGLVELQAVIDEVKEAYGNDALHLAGLVLTKVGRTVVHRDVEAELRARFGVKVFRSTIPASVKVDEAYTHARPVMQHAPKSPVAIGYEGLVDEVLSYGREAHGESPVRRPRKGSAA
jgi:chromosome partitioning protein